MLWFQVDMFELVGFCFGFFGWFHWADEFICFRFADIRCIQYWIMEMEKQMGYNNLLNGKIWALQIYYVNGSAGAR